jgi:integrase
VTWAYRVEVARPGQPRSTQQKGGFRTAAEAATARARVLTELEDGLFVPSSKLTLGQYLDRWFATGPTKGWTPNTTRHYRVGIQHINRYLGDVLLQELTREHVQRLYATLLKEGKLPRKAGGKSGPLARKTVAKFHICLHAALTEAVAATPPLRRGNPAADAYTYSRERAGEELPCWTLEEMRLFLAFVANRRDAGLYAVALATGMRRGELLGLRRKRDVDLAHARILVRRQWTKAGDEGRRMMPLKTGQKAWRTIDLDPFTVAVIERQIEMLNTERRQ